MQTRTNLVDLAFENVPAAYDRFGGFLDTAVLAAWF